MAFCRLVFPLLVLSVVSCYASNVPLYMWGLNPLPSSRASALATVPEAEFTKILSDYSIGEQEDQLTVVFIEETLSVEDFSNKNHGETSFPYLYSELKDAVYLPSVENAVHALKKRAGKAKSKIELTDKGLTAEIPAKYSETDNFVLIRLKDAREDESRSEMLSRHDEFMRETITKMEEHYKTVVGIYTAKKPSWIIPEAPVTHSRVRRAVGARNTYTIDGLALYVSSISLKRSNETSSLTTFSTATSTFGENTMASKLNFENSTSLTLNFNRKNGYWFFDSVVLATATTEDPLSPLDDEVYALEGFSYRCAQYVKFSSNATKDYILTFQDLKIQPFFETTNETVKFGESFNCVGYFTAPIWSGLLVVFFLLSITFYGIMMMLDIRTMDRFDDPKGKTITINSAE